MTDVSLAGAFLAGLISFLSPCVLPLVPGYISSLNARFETLGERLMPCHEFCGVGHEGMWGRIKVVDKVAFARMAEDRRRLSCVE